MKDSEQINTLFSLGENRNEGRRLINSYDFMSKKMIKSKNFLLEKIKSTSTNNFELPVQPSSAKQMNRSHKSVPKKITLLQYENDQEFPKVSYRLKNYHYFDEKNEHV